MWEKLKSRKLWLTVAAVSGHVLLGVSGHESWQEVGSNATMLVAAYLAVQGYVDSKKSGQ